MPLDYRPGEQNITEFGRQWRLAAAVAAFVAFTGLLLTGPWFVQTPIGLGFAAFILFNGFEGFFQAETRFCSWIGLFGYRESTSDRYLEAVENTEYLRQDRRKAAIIHAGVLVFTALTLGWVTALAILTA